MATKVANRSVATAMAIVGRASRACDVCASKSARWYCGADAAYLCDRCDTQVHSANALAQRHERVRLTPSGTPMKPPRKPQESTPKAKPPTGASKKKKSPAPPQVLPARKRSRTSRPHPHRRPEAQPLDEVEVKVEESNLFSDFFDTEDFLVDDTHEVPSFDGSPASSPSPSPSSGSEYTQEFSLSPEFHSDLSSPSEDSFAAYFKGKAAHDEFLVPDGFDSGIDIICCDADGNISLASDACFIPGDIPGLEAFDDCSLSFDLAQRGVAASSEAFEGENGTTTTSNAGIVGSGNDEFSNGPFAKYFVKKRKVKAESAKKVMSPEVIKSEAKEILRCCLEGESERTVPTLRLNYDEIITAWSNRGEPWVNPVDSATDVGLVPDMELQGGDADDGGQGREARVLRYKEKRRSRLFSKTIRYEVRKLNAERRPRMKGRFVKRTNNSY
ncbi:hypothetical protein M758_9G138100 [Ceratodon purpureus]|nr:hypothetical protein M758_9G138100 [Ceratodon purpureus]